MKTVIRGIHIASHATTVTIVDNMSETHTVKTGDPEEEEKDPTVITGIQTMTSTNAPELIREMITVKVQTGIVVTHPNMTRITVMRDPTMMINVIPTEDHVPEMVTRIMIPVATEMVATIMVTRVDPDMMKTVAT